MELGCKFNSKIFLMALMGIIMVCSSYLTFIYDPLNMIIRKMATLAPGSVFFYLWSTPPYDVIFRVYIFNVTNHEAFLAGREKLKTEELGPYVYKEYLTNSNATFNDDGTVSFIPNRVAELDLERSVGDPNKLRVIVPNIPLIGMQASLSDASWFKNVGFSTASRMMGSKSFLNLTITEYLWGYEDRLITIGNQFIPSWIDFGKFGILSRLFSRDNNNTVTMLVDPSKSNFNNSLLTESQNKAPYHITKWNDSPGMEEWGYQQPTEDEPNPPNNLQMLVEGSFDGTLFPREMAPNTSLTMFRKAFCRPVPLQYVNSGFTKDGFKSLNYKMADDIFDLPETNPVNQVYCPKGKCPLRGLSNISPCYYDIPIVLSRPHFLHADPQILEKVDCCKPNATLHEGIAMIHPDLGVPVGGNLKIQINLDVGETKQNSKTKPFNNLIVPLFWIELTMGDLPWIVYTLVNLSCHVGPLLQKLAIYLLGLLGLALISCSALLILVFNRPTVQRSLSLPNDYSPLPIISIPAQYFKPDIRICK